MVEEEEKQMDTGRRTAPKVAKRSRFLFERQHIVEVEAKVENEQRSNAAMESANPPRTLHRTRYLFDAPSPVRPKIVTGLPSLPPSAECCQRNFATNNPITVNEISTGLHPLGSQHLAALARLHPFTSPFWCASDLNYCWSLRCLPKFGDKMPLYALPLSIYFSPSGASTYSLYLHFLIALILT